MSVHIKHGVSKRRPAEKRKNIEKKFRRLSSKEPDDANSVSGSQSITKKKTFNRFIGDRARKLLEIVAQTARVVDPHEIKSIPVDLAGRTDFKQIDILNKIDKKSKKKKKSYEKIAVGKQVEMNDLTLDQNEVKNTNVSSRSSVTDENNYHLKLNEKHISHNAQNGLQEQRMDKISSDAIKGKPSARTFEDSLMHSLPKFDKKLKSKKKNATKQKTMCNEQDSVAHGECKVITDRTSNASLGDKGNQLNYSKKQSKKHISLNVSNSTEEKNEVKTFGAVIKNKRSGKPLKGSSISSLKNKKLKKNVSKQKKKFNEQDDIAYRECNVVSLCEPIMNSPAAVNYNQYSINRKVKLSDDTNMEFKDINKHCRTSKSIESEMFEKHYGEDFFENGKKICNDSTSLVCVRESKTNKKKLKSHTELSSNLPILIEMSGNYGVPSNPFEGHTTRIKKHDVKSVFKNKSDLKLRPCVNVTSTQNWEVQYGNSNCIQEETPFQDSLRPKPEYTENEFPDTNVLGIPQYGMNLLSPQNDEYNACNSVENVSNYNSVHQYKLFTVSETEMILALPQYCSIFFRGALKVKVLVGKINILGCELNSINAAGPCNVYSPNGTSYLGFRASVQEDTFPSEEEYWAIVQDNISDELQGKIINEVSAFTTLILVESVNNNIIAFLDKFFPSVHFPTITSRKIAIDAASVILKGELMEPGNNNMKIYEERAEWNSLVNFLLQCKPDDMRIMVCGGKGVGKSTLLRFLTNQMWSKFKKVLYIDLDPAQCEFTPPGFVSAVIVENPLLGPNFTHLTLPIRTTFVGAVNTSTCAVHYMQCVQNVIDWCCSQSFLAQLPWLINTMGFCKGLGVEMIVSSIRTIQPSDLIEIRSRWSKRNFPILLNSKNVNSYTTSLHQSINRQDKGLVYSFYEVPSAAEDQNTFTASWGMAANLARDTALLSYFCQAVTPPAFSLLEATTQILPFSGLKLCVGHEKLRFSDYLSAMNANVVALCDASNFKGLKPNDPEYPEILEKIPICHYLGLGIVRCVDLKKKMIFIISPLTTDQFKSVNCLVLGTINLPDNVYTLQDGALGSIPYVIHGKQLLLGQNVKAAKSNK